jgi:ubiquinone/menaquinone biosynthesis C-methylase UbiE
MTLRNQLLENSSLAYEKNIFYQKGFQRNNSFQETYLKLRLKENRVHSDDIVRALPEFSAGHPNKKEWEMRKSTLQELVRQLAASGAKSVLELGCGNGWLSHNLAKSLNADICAVDVNEPELQQGARVFGGQENLCFVYANIFSAVFKPKKFDAIVLGSSVQYFQDLKNLFVTLFDLTAHTGTIYIVDSPFYKTQAESVAAKNRSKRYFDSIGFPEMAGQYFHHTFDELKDFNYKIPYNPTSLTSLFKRKILKMTSSVFPIICISKEGKF